MLVVYSCVVFIFGQHCVIYCSVKWLQELMLLAVHQTAVYNVSKRAGKCLMHRYHLDFTNYVFIKGIVKQPRYTL
jgi:hypothetical protein